MKVYRLIVASAIASLATVGLWACNNSDNPVAPSGKNFGTFQAADVVIGQPDFVTSSSDTSQTKFNYPYGNPAAGSLFVSDYSNRRLLGYDSIPTTNGAPATYVIGQGSFTSSTYISPITDLSVNCPETSVEYNGKLLVTDFCNNRILIWNTKPTNAPINTTPADVVVGQGAFDSNSSACSINGLNQPESIAVVGGSLVVADSGNNRVLVWKTIPTSNGVSADYVIGQPDFNGTCADNNTDPIIGGLSDHSLYYPTDVAYIGGKLVIADGNNNRVLIWNTLPSCDNSPCPITTPADVVLGQPNFSVDNGTNTGGLSATSLSYPYYLGTDGTRLAVADYNNHRVLIWNSVPTCTPTGFARNCATTTPANVVLGQIDFEHDVANSDSTGATASVSANNLNYPAGLLFTSSNQLLVTDSSNSRVLVFNAK